MLRSILSVIAGYLAMSVATIAGVLLLAKAFGHPPDPNAVQSTPSLGYILCNLAVSFGGAVLGGFVAARVASKAPVRHALVLGAVLLLLGVVYAVKGWSGIQPGWYLIVLPLVGAAGVTAGGFLVKGRRGGE